LSSEDRREKRFYCDQGGKKEKGARRVLACSLPGALQRRGEEEGGRKKNRRGRGPLSQEAEKKKGNEKILPRPSFMAGEGVRKRRENGRSESLVRDQP